MIYRGVALEALGRFQEAASDYRSARMRYGSMCALRWS